MVIGHRRNVAKVVGVTSTESFVVVVMITCVKQEILRCLEFVILLCYLLIGFLKNLKIFLPCDAAMLARSWES